MGMSLALVLLLHVLVWVNYAGTCFAATCEAGKYSSGSKCNFCSKGKTSNSDRTQCVNCDAGKFVYAAGLPFCPSCPSGKTSSSGASSCSASSCGAGVYRTELIAIWSRYRSLGHQNPSID
jgi:hypothetical protein